MCVWWLVKMYLVAMNDMHCIVSGCKYATHSNMRSVETYG